MHTRTVPYYLQSQSFGAHVWEACSCYIMSVAIIYLLKEEHRGWLSLPSVSTIVDSQCGGAGFEFEHGCRARVKPKPELWCDF